MQVSEKEMRDALSDARDLVTLNEGQPLDMLCTLTPHGATQNARALIALHERLKGDEKALKYLDRDLRFAVESTDLETTEALQKDLAFKVTNALERPVVREALQKIRGEK